MIAMVSGKLAEKADGEALIMTAGGLGLRINCSMNTLSALPAVGGECTLLTHLSVKEDALELFGFSSQEERELFRKLISVSGIGPKSALQVLGSMPLSNLRLAILTGDTAALSRAPGVGKKTAQRIALELKDKLAQDALSMDSGAETVVLSAGTPAGDAVSEAMLALKSLGYTPQEAAAALKGVEGTTADELIKQALRRMVSNG